MSVIFEVRIPTYNRPALLLRAIRSLQSQTYPHWLAIVYDETSSGEEVVRAISDGRVRYSRNPLRLGACANIDQCFSLDRVLGGHYGYILEDDNFLMPGFLARVAAQIEKRPWPIIQVNQRIFSDARGLHPDTETTLGDRFDSGVVEPKQLWASGLINHGLSNGGLVWRLEGECDLRVGPQIKHVGLQEICRSLLVRVPFLFVEDPLAVFMYMPKEETARNNEDNRLFGRGQQSVRRFILRHLGTEVTTLLKNKPDAKNKITSILAHSGYLRLIEPSELKRPQVAKSYLKGIALRLVQQDPCSRFLSDLQSRYFSVTPSATVSEAIPA